MTKRLSKAQAAFLEDQDAKRAVQALGDKMDLELEYQHRQLELDRREHEIRAAAEADQYRARRVGEEVAARAIAPQFVDYIAGSTTDEVEASIQLAKSKTAEIAAEMQEARQKSDQPRDHLGRWTISGNPEPEMDFTKLSYADYVRQRDQIMRSSQDLGIFN
jgi:hypothetical protein